MPTQQCLPPDGTPPGRSDWLTLVDRVVDDALRIMRCEVAILQARVIDAVESQASHAIAQLGILAMMIVGGLCLLCAAILLLHQWLLWWQSFGIVGLTVILVGVATRALLRTRRAFRH
jgi:hypothetical protein